MRFQELNVTHNIRVLDSDIGEIIADCFAASASFKEELIDPRPTRVKAGQVNDVLTVNVSDSPSSFRRVKLNESHTVIFLLRSD